MKEIDQPPNLFIIYVLGLPRLPKKKFGVWGPHPHGTWDPPNAPKIGQLGGPWFHRGGAPRPQIFLGLSR